MRFLKIMIVTFFLVFSAACYFLSGQKNAPAGNLQTFFTLHAQTFRKAAPENIKGDFERENNFELGAVKAAMSRNGADFFIAFKAAGQNEVYKIEAVVGTEKLEEYIAKKDEKLIRLPIAYDLTQKRWMNLSAAFFEPDDQEFFKHQKDWNAECASCHLENISPNSESFDVKKLTSDQILLACGSCHAKGGNVSFPKIEEIMSSNKEYSADLSVAPQNTSETFENGAIRLSSHEYQGILRSVCFVKNKGGEKINCLTCHSVENGRIDVERDEKLRAPESCTSCHREFSTPELIAEHTRHQINSEAVSCIACHMPEVVYGHLKFQRTHEISIPDAELTVLKAVPNACNLCHTDRSVNWAIEKSKMLWAEHFRAAKISGDAQFDEAEGLRGLFAGDALTRALMADALRKHAAPNWFAPFVFEAAQDENYSLVRYFLENALAANKNLPKLADISSKTENQVKRIARKLRLKRKKIDLEIAE